MNYGATTRYHLNMDTGRPNLCRANIRDCPVGGEHFNSKEEARAGYEQLMDEANKALESISKSRAEPLPDRRRLSGEELEMLDQANALVTAGKRRLWDQAFTDAIAGLGLRDPKKKQAKLERALRSLGPALRQPNLNNFAEAGEAERRLRRHLTNELPKTYGKTPAQRAQALADQLLVTELEPGESYAVEYECFRTNPTADNYRALLRAATPSGDQLAGHMNGGDHLAIAIVKSEASFMKKDMATATHVGAGAAGLLTSAEEWADYDRRNPATALNVHHGEERTPAPIGSVSLDKDREIVAVAGYHSVPNSTFRVAGAKSSPNGSAMVVEHTDSGWYASTSAGVMLRGPFSDFNQAADCACERSLDLGGRYYD